MILYGSAGTGKTLLLVEVLRIKIAHYKILNNKPIKLIVGTYQSNRSMTDHLKQDLKKRYNIQDILNEFEVEPQTLDEASKGKLLNSNHN